MHTNLDEERVQSRSFLQNRLWMTPYMLRFEFETVHIIRMLQIFVSKSYDATSHFETTCIDVLDIFRRATGADFDFSKVQHNLEDQE